MNVSNVDRIFTARLDAMEVRIASEKARQPARHVSLQLADEAAIADMEARLAVLDACNERLAQDAAAQMEARLAAVDAQTRALAQQYTQAVETSRVAPRATASPRSWEQRRHTKVGDANLELRAQLEQVVGMHSELMEHVKRAADEDARQRAAADKAERVWRQQLEAAARNPPSNWVPAVASPQLRRRDGSPSAVPRSAGSAHTRAALGEPLASAHGEPVHGHPSLKGASEALAAGGDSDGEDDGNACEARVADAVGGGGALEDRERLSVGDAGAAVLFGQRVHARGAQAAISETETRELVQEMTAGSVSWLRAPLRPIVQSILADTSLQLDLHAAASGPPRRRGLFFRRGGGGGSAKAIEAQASKLMVRVRSVMEALLTAVPDAPEPLLHAVHLLCHTPCTWPPELPLTPSEIESLAARPDGAWSPQEGSPLRLVVGLLLVRVVVLKQLLRPHEHGLAAKAPSALAAANLRMIGATVLYLCHAGLASGGGEARLEGQGRALAGVDGEGVGALDKTETQRTLLLDAATTAPLAPELQRLVENGIPLLGEWPAQGLVLVRSWGTAILRASEAQSSSGAT